MRFCAKCGRNERSVPMVRYLCVDCYLELKGNDILPGNINLTYCPSCRSYKVENEWINYNDVGGDERIVIAYIIERRLKIPGEVSNASIEGLEIIKTGFGEVIEINLRINIENSQHIVKRRVSLYREKRLCPACYKIRGKGYEAVLQIRGTPSLSKSLLRAIEESINRLPEALKASIAEIENLREGIDLKLVSQHAAQSIAGILKKEFGGKILETKENETRIRVKANKRSRLVISLRIPSIEEGSYIRINGAPYRVESVDEEKVVLINRDGERVIMTKRDIVRNWD